MTEEIERYTERQRAGIAARLVADFRAIAGGFDPPEQRTLEECVERTAKCAKCGGGARAICLEAHDGDKTTCDLEILVQLYCRDAACGWETRQWRPWSRERRDEL